MVFDFKLNLLLIVEAYEMKEILLSSYSITEIKISPNFNTSDNYFTGNPKDVITIDPL